MSSRQLAQPSPQAAMAVARDIKARCARVATCLEAIATNPDATFADPPGVFLELFLCVRELEAGHMALRSVYWPSL